MQRARPSLLKARPNVVSSAHHIVKCVNSLSTALQDDLHPPTLWHGILVVPCHCVLHFCYSNSAD